MADVSERNGLTQRRPPNNNAVHDAQSNDSHTRLSEVVVSADSTGIDNSSKGPTVGNGGHVRGLSSANTANLPKTPVKEGFDKKDLQTSAVNSPTGDDDSIIDGNANQVHATTTALKDPSTLVGENNTLSSTEESQTDDSETPVDTQGTADDDDGVETDDDESVYEVDHEFPPMPIPPVLTPPVENTEIKPDGSPVVTYIWPEPQAPYKAFVKEFEQEQPNPYAFKQIFFEIMTSMKVLFTVAYLMVLYRQASVASLLSAVPFFVAAQYFEQIGNVLEGIWKTVINCVRKRSVRAKLFLVGNNVPSVDVFIVCCGEPPNAIMDTVKAACKIDWPMTRLRIIVADDGRSAEVKEMVLEHAGKHSNLYYHSRDKPVNRHHGYKAGNLNSTLRDFVKHLPSGYAEFIAVFDADMMPSPSVLRRLIPHAIKDDNLAMVTAAQFHFNIPDNDLLNQGNTTGTGADDDLRDRANAAWCPGSGFILRLNAWSSIGGFPEFSITEDLITSWFLHGRGWLIALVPGRMQWGLQPDCFLTHVKQRRRWWTGHMRDALRFNFTLWDERLSGATFFQRYAMFQHSLRPYHMTLTHAISTFLNVMCLGLGGPVVGFSNVGELKLVLGCLNAIRFVSWIEEIKSVFDGGYFRNRCAYATGVWMGHHFSRATLLTLVPTRFGGLRLDFGVSGVDDRQKVAVKERDLKQRPDLFTRLDQIHDREGVLWHPALFFFILSVAVCRIWLLSRSSTNTNGTDEFWLNLVTSVGFPGLALIDNVPYYLTPLVYIVFPPATPEHRELMRFSSRRQIWVPKQENKEVRYTKAI